MIKLNKTEFSYLKDFLEDYYPDHELDRAVDLIPSVFNERRNHTGIYSGFIQDTKRYFSEVIIDNYEDHVSFYCTCSQNGDCVHVLALSLKLIENTSPIAKVIQLHNNRSKIIKETKEIFGTAETSKFRKIPQNKNISIEEITSILSIQYPKISNNHVDVYLQPGNLLQVEGRQFMWNNKEIEDQYSSIEIKGDHQEYFVKCNCCNRKINRLCDHQQAIFENYHFIEFYKKWISGEIANKHDPIAKHYLDELGITSETLQQNFRIWWNLKIDSWALKRKDISMVYYPEFENGIAQFTNKEINNTDLILEELESIIIRGNALLWDLEGNISILEGKYNKARTKLISQFQETEFPIYFDQEELNLWQKLEKGFLSMDSCVVRPILLSNLDILSKMLSYYHKDEYSTKLTKNTISEFSIVNVLANMTVDYSEKDGLSHFIFHINIGNILIDPKNIDWYNQYFIIFRNQAYFYNEPGIYDLLCALEGRSKLTMIKKLLKDNDIFIDKINKIGSLKLPEEKLKKLRGGKKQIYIREINKFLVFEPVIMYSDHKFSLYEKMEKLNLQEKIRVVGNKKLQDEFMREFRQFHPFWDKEYVPQHYVYLHLDEALENFWILDFFEKCKELNIAVFGQEKLNNLKINTNKAFIRSHVTSGIDWFDAQVEIKYGNQEVAQKAWVEAIKNNQTYIQLSDGTFGVIPENWIKKLQKLLSSVEIEKDNLRISKYKFNILDDLFEEIDDEELRKEVLGKKRALNNYQENKKYKLPNSLNVELRPYQLQGYQWLKFCEEYGFGACLADDMGLGKTVQVLALLLDQKKQEKGTSLVIVPRSLLFNWANEIEKFAPDVKYLIHHGNNRNNELDGHINYDLIISTYDTIIRDVINIKNIVWNYIILDESQAIKNPNSKRYKAVRLLQSHHKLVLTGTPIENHTFDLYAQFSFLNPGIFGSQKSFKDNYAVPIDQYSDKEKTESLKKIIFPFLLRRTKEQVAQDLPEKTESIIYCDMGKEQRKQYDKLKNHIKASLEDKLEEGNAKFMILDGLLKLRQICNSPELIDSKLPKNKRDSVKVDTLLDLLTEDLGNHKALIFSQFVSMLSIIKRHLEQKNINYAYLDGSTRDRQKAIKEFTDDDNCQVFLISLKAGNTGLNLTEADYVYIIDPWWNPAVEAQAIDRTHRIGQDKKVFAYKMICKNTIEEKIIELQNRKKALAKDLIQVDENVFKSLNKEELMALFE